MDISTPMGNRPGHEAVGRGKGGATHYTHWFQPMTGVTAEKHDSFIAPAGSLAEILMEFSGKSWSG